MLQSRIMIAVLSFALMLGTGMQSGNNNTSGSGGQQTIEGLVRDIACPIRNNKASATEFNSKCALECVRQGSPIIIQTKDGVLYIPISDSMPDKDQKSRLMPFVGKYVKATGKVYERSGTHAIVIDNISEMKNVPVITDAQ